MNLSIIGIVGVPSRYGGFETLVENLLPLNEDTLVYCSARSYSSKEPSYKKAKLVYLPLDANGVQSILYDALAIIHTLFRTKNDLLVLGVSGAIMFPFVKIFFRRSLVVNIDGLEWKRDKWGTLAKKFLKFSEWLSVQCADVVIADNAAIASYVDEEYGRKSEVVAYGGDHALVSDVSVEAQDYALSLCRIEPENNVDLILKAFSLSPNQKLKFVGNWSKSSYGCDLKAEYSKCENIELLDPIYDIDQLFALRAGCKIYVHGHSAGGTNPSLVEMMHFGKPVLCYDCSYNRETTEYEAIYFSTFSELAVTLDNGKMSELVGEKMKDIASRRYTWNIVKRQYLEIVGS